LTSALFGLLGIRERSDWERLRSARLLGLLPPYFSRLPRHTTGTDS